MRGQRDLYPVGEKHGLLTITRRWTEKSPSHATKETYVECECECGTKGVILRACYLKDTRKKTFSCGCLTTQGRRKLYKPGERHGKLVILRKWTKKRKNNSKESIVECECDCGNIVTVPSRYLKNESKCSCGCLVLRTNKDHPCWGGHGEISAERWGNIKRGRKRRSRELHFEITIEEAWELFQKQHGKCALSGVDITFNKKSMRYSANSTASLDRIDSNKGYTLDNIQWVHKDVNCMKWSLPQDVFVKWCKVIAGHNSVIL